MALTCGLTVGLGCVCWQRQRERDRGTDQVEGLPLGAGGLGEHLDLGAGAAEADLVAGQRGQVAEQAAEAALGAAVLVVLTGCLGRGSLGAAGGRDRAGLLAWFLVGVSQGTTEAGSRR